jgi:D-lactate dehydrogenase (cytochrome)
VGGSISQNTISHGSGKFGISAQSVLAMDVVLASGALLSTGSSGAGLAPFSRHFGPDLTGLFTGDCGALGIKARITLPVIKKLKAHRTISFSFADFESMHESMRLIAREQIEDTHFALDGALSQGQIARQENAGQMIKIAWSILNSSPSYWEGFKQLIKSATSAKKAISSSPYMTHYIVEGFNDAEVKARMHRLRELNTNFGHEIPATVPSIVRGMPFAPFYNTLGPKGERWVPLHGLLPHSKVPEFHKALEALYEQHKSKMDTLGVWYGGMFGSAGSSSFLYEVALYWPDEISAYHREVIPHDYLEQLPKYPKNTEAREFVHQLKTEITELLIQFEAIHFQIGKAYPYIDRLLPETKKLINDIKESLDPNNLSSPGSLGFE